MLGGGGNVDDHLPVERLRVLLIALVADPHSRLYAGEVTLDQLRDIAATGVDRISIGKLTKDVKAVDFSLRVLERIGG